MKQKNLFHPLFSSSNIFFVESYRCKFVASDHLILSFTHIFFIPSRLKRNRVIQHRHSLSTNRGTPWNKKYRNQWTFAYIWPVSHQEKSVIISELFAYIWPVSHQEQSVIASAQPRLPVELLADTLETIPSFLTSYLLHTYYYLYCSRIPPLLSLHALQLCISQFQRNRLARFSETVQSYRARPSSISFFFHHELLHYFFNRSPRILFTCPNHFKTFRSLFHSPFHSYKLCNPHPHSSIYYS